MSARVIPDLKPNEDYKLECEEIFKIIQQWALCGLDFVFSWNWYSYRPWEGEDTALYTTRGVSLHTSSACVQGDLLKTLSTCGLISSLPRQFYPFYSWWSSVFSWPEDAEDSRRPGPSRCRVLTSRASWQSIRDLMTATASRADTGHGAITGDTGPHYYTIIRLFVIPCLVFIVHVIIVTKPWCCSLLL